MKLIRDDVKQSINITKIIQYNGKTIGMITTDSLDEGWWYIGELYLDEEYRGKGIGTILLKNEIENHDKIKLQVAQSNYRAIALYESLGFKIIESYEKGNMHVMAYEKDNSMNEAVSDLKSHEANDIFHNIEDWENGKSNILWVTGLSGSGKSTIAKDVSTYYNNVEHVELDNLQRAKMDNWDTTGSKLTDDYIKSKGGLYNIFSYVNDLEEIRWKDIVSNETECPKQFDDFFNYIINYANKNKHRRFVVEGVQLAMCAKDI